MSEHTSYTRLTRAEVLEWANGQIATIRKSRSLACEKYLNEANERRAARPWWRLWMALRPLTDETIRNTDLYWSYPDVRFKRSEDRLRELARAAKHGGPFVYLCVEDVNTLHGNYQ